MYRELYTEGYTEKMTRLFDENDVEMTTVKLKGGANTSSSAVVDGHELNSFEMMYIAIHAVANLATDVIAEAGPGVNGERYAAMVGAMVAGIIRRHIHDSQRGA